MAPLSTPRRLSRQAAFWLTDRDADATSGYPVGRVSQLEGLAVGRTLVYLRPGGGVRGSFFDHQAFESREPAVEVARAIVRLTPPYVYLDGVILKRSWADEVRNISVLVAMGIGPRACGGIKSSGNACCAAGSIA
jgi:hypothetical protein